LFQVLAALRWLKQHNTHYKNITIDERFRPNFPELERDNPTDPNRPESILLHLTHHGFADINPPTYRGTATEHFLLTKMKGLLMAFHFYHG